MAFLGVFVFAGVGGESVGLEVNSDNFYEDASINKIIKEINLPRGSFYLYFQGVTN